MKNLKMCIPLGNPLLPNLLRLSISWFKRQDDTEYLVFVLSLLHPGLEYVDLSPPANTASTVAILAHTQSSCARLGQLHLRNLRCDPSPMLSSFPQLRSLVLSQPQGTVMNLEPQSIRSLGSLPRLQRLSVSFMLRASSFPDESQAPQSFIPFFPVLEDLRLDNVTYLPAAAQLIRLIQSSVLQRLSIRYTLSERHHADNIHSLAEAVAIHTRLHDVTALLRTLETPPATSLAALRSLAGLRYIRRLRLTKVVSADSLTDEAICRLTQSWYHLEEFSYSRLPLFWEFAPDGPELDNVPTRPTLAVLRIFATNCPRLMYLQLGIDCTQVPVLEDEADGDARSMLALQFRIDPSTVTDEDKALDVAEYISEIYPNIQIRIPFANNTVTKCAWKDIQSFMDVLNRTRLRERRRLALLGRAS
jgi:hypothetical protein